MTSPSSPPTINENKPMNETNSDLKIIIKKGPGDRLRFTREQANLNISEVAKYLFLNHHIIEAMENDDYEKIPGIVFIRGYLRAYARFLNLPENEILQSFDTLDIKDEAASDTVHQNLFRSSNNYWETLLPWITGVVALIMIILVFTWWRSQSGDTNASNPALPSTPTSISEQQAKSTQNSINTPNKIDPSNPNALKLPSQTTNPSLDTGDSITEVKPAFPSLPRFDGASSNENPENIGSSSFQRSVPVGPGNETSVKPDEGYAIINETPIDENTAADAPVKGKKAHRHRKAATRDQPADNVNVDITDPSINLPFTEE